MGSNRGGDPDFSGFEYPEQNWFRLPNSWTNITSGITSLAELKVVEYVLRHTWGYREFGIAKRISTNEFMRGRRRHDGTRIDMGTGLSNRSVIDGLRKAVQHGYLVEARDDRDKGRVQKSYSLRMKHLQPAMNNLHRGVKNSHTDYEESSHRSEKETQERNSTVLNGDQSVASPLAQLPDLEVDPAQAAVIADDIVAHLGDSHSRRFYDLVARKVPAAIIYQAISEIRNDGADTPPRVFTYRMNRFALDQLTKLDSR